MKKTADALTVAAVKATVNSNLELVKPQSRREFVLDKLVNVMSTQFSTPEYSVCHEGETGEELFFIQTGDCIVNIRDHNLREATAVRLLTEGDFFGEIAVVYEDAKRTAEIVCRNYVTMAVISRQHFKVHVAPDLPELAI